MKSTFKAICALLAVVLLFSALPMSTFAAETEAHIHTDGCCQENASPLFVCRHDFTETLSSRAVPLDGDYHEVFEIVVKTCIYCGYTVKEDVGYRGESPHTWLGWVLIYEDENIREYKMECKYCGFALYKTTNI